MIHGSLSAAFVGKTARFVMLNDLPLMVHAT
jgi:hypothetical protein